MNRIRVDELWLHKRERDTLHYSVGASEHGHGLGGAVACTNVDHS
jgi:hypothetical protein